jgi:hypothetical protein
MPGDRLILRRVGIYIGETKLLGIGRFTISLKPRMRQNRLPITPDVGSDRYSGFFVRTSVSLFDTKTQSADFVFDWSERRGIGYGIEHDYSTRRFKVAPTSSSNALPSPAQSKLSRGVISINCFPVCFLLLSGTSGETLLSEGEVTPVRPNNFPFGKVGGEVQLSWL